MVGRILLKGVENRKVPIELHPELMLGSTVRAEGALRPGLAIGMHKL